MEKQKVNSIFSSNRGGFRYKHVSPSICYSQAIVATRDEVLVTLSTVCAHRQSLTFRSKHIEYRNLWALVFPDFFGWYTMSTVWPVHVCTCALGIHKLWEYKHTTLPKISVLEKWTDSRTLGDCQRLLHKEGWVGAESALRTHAWHTVTKNWCYVVFWSNVVSYKRLLRSSTTLTYASVEKNKKDMRKFKIQIWQHDPLTVFSTNKKGKKRSESKIHWIMRCRN